MRPPARKLPPTRLRGARAPSRGGGRRVAVATACSAALALGCATGGAPPAQGPAGATGPNATGAAAPPVSQGPSWQQRVDGAIGGFFMGSVMGGIFGLPGAAVGGLSMAIYGAVKGSPPLSGGGGGYVGGGTGGYSGGYGGYGGSPGGYYPPADPAEAQREAEMEAALERELAKGENLEDQIEAELRRQEELLRQIDRDEETQEALRRERGDELSEAELEQVADPRAAPRAPAERDLPAAIFDEEQRTVAEGRFGNDGEVMAARRSLDADRDGNPEMVRWVDPATGAFLHKEEDHDYDGAIDTWSDYQAGRLSELRRDHDGDGQPDEWEFYGPDGVMTRREVDRNYDGVRDAFYEYNGGSLVAERHDGNADGEIDRVVEYEGRKLAHTEEDLDRDGSTDTWTTFSVAGHKEVVSRIEKDTTGDGRPDVFETYEQAGEKTVLSKREEDKNGDGQIDVLSIYEDGKLKERQIHDPALLPL